MKLLTRILTSIALIAGAHAQDFNGTQLTERALVADTAAVEAGKPFTVGLHFKIAEHWHTYWRFAGASGSPVKAEWQLPEGWKAGPIEFPLPVVTHDEYGNTFFGYENEVLFPVKIAPPAQLAPGEVKLVAKLDWLVCEKTCVPGEGPIELKIPVGTAKPANTELFTKWMGLLPKTTAPPAHKLSFEGKDKTLVARLSGFAKDAKVEFFPLPPEDYKGGIAFGEKIESSVADDGTRNYSFPFESPVASLDKWQALVVVEKEGKREGWLVAGSGGGSANAAALDPFALVKPEETTSFGALLALLVQGLFGGLLLNLMPCVLPVISIKIFGFVNQAGVHKDRVFKLGLAFCAGVFVFFYALAALILGVNAAGEKLGWGFQFQNAYVLTGMIAMVFAFGLSLLGVFEITLGGGTSSKLGELSAKDGPGGSFLHGFFTTLLGTSCTAPFLAPVLGAALNQPGPRVFLLFTAIALGLCLPYLLLSWQPAWLRFLPKPGMWMVRFKQIMGFVQLALIVWLFKSIAVRGPDAVITVLAFLLVLGVGCWLLGSYHERRWALPVAIVVAALGWAGFVHGKLETRPATGQVGQPGTDELVWEPFTKERLGALLSEGRPVFIDFTAEWCANCKTFEALAINTAPSKAAFRQKKVALLKADFTDKSPELSAVLAKFGRAGVPLYVLYSKPDQPPWVADTLTQGALLEQLNKL